MVNLLPTNDVKRVLWEHRRRIGIIAIALTSIATVLALLFAIPSAIITWSGVAGFDAQLQATKTLVDLQRKQGGGDVLIDLSSRSNLLEAALSQRTPTSILEDVVPRIPSGVRVMQISYTYGDSGVTVSVLGTATTRAALIAFGNNLRQSALFSRVDVPISSLARSEDIDFGLTLSLSEPVSIDSYGTRAADEEPEATATQTEL
ncbi:MAG: hypothetical protein AMXMBFR44_0290 [Candidatus Campbellbacteria bacterium]